MPNLHFGMTSIELGILVGLCLLVAGLMVLRKLPSSEGIKDVVAVLNSRGGNILVLLILTAVFFRSAMKFIYYTLGLLQDNKLTVDNAVMMIGISFVTGTAFGGAFGAMLKTMTGETLPSKPTNGNGQHVEPTPPLPEPKPQPPPKTLGIVG